MAKSININDFDYPLPDERIAKFPLERRDNSKLLVYRNGEITERRFSDIGQQLDSDTLFVFNNTKVVRARLVMHKSSGARVEVFCLEPTAPADYERAFAATAECCWSCIVGNLKKWKQGAVQIPFSYQGAEYLLEAFIAERGVREHIVRFVWDAPMTFGQLLEYLGRIPIPPYLNRESEDIDNTRYQTVYSRFEGSVAAPTAGLHFTEELIEGLKSEGFTFGEVTLHVGAGTFLPVKDEDATKHAMHTEHFEVTVETLELLRAKIGKVTAVGTTSVRTLESLAALAWRVKQTADAQTERVIGQWELYDIPADFMAQQVVDTLIEYLAARGEKSIKAATQIMITPLGYRFRIVNRIVTNFHQPKSTLLLLVSAYVGEDWHKIYDYALANDFRFLSYGDSSLLVVE
ncbi:MAG: S-adenosylmethionine:tRNA ribosyltransferase-isomerase [Alistipes sp.]|nr:S-adenosylmethionine:tRNA ribosyltransferase-isomerase [Alistipes sp.]